MATQEAAPQLNVQEEREAEWRRAELIVAAAGELATPQLFQVAGEAYMNDVPFGD